MKTLRETAMLASLNISLWQARKMDAKATADVIASANAESDAGRFNKALVAKTALASVRRVVNAARQTHAYNTAAWATGSQILAGTNHARYSDAMRKHRLDFESAVRDFVAEYPSYISQARARLGSMFEARDYPTANVIAREFSFDVEIMPISESSDFRIVEMSKADQDKARMDIAARNDKRLADSTADVWQRVQKRVEHLRDKLAGYDPDKPKASPFRDSCIDGLRAQIEILPALNIAGNADLVALARDIESDLLRVEPQELRDDNNARAAVQKAAAKLAERMAAGPGAAGVASRAVAGTASPTTGSPVADFLAGKS